MRPIAVSLLVFLVVASALAQEPANSPPLENDRRPPIDTGNKGGPPLNGTTGVEHSSDMATVEADATKTTASRTTGNLPPTASSLPLLAVLGLIAAAASLTLALVRRRRSEG
jgi:hypothetical protein